MNLKNIKKTIYLLVSLTVLFIMICGCSNNSQSTSSSTKKQSKTVIDGDASFAAFSIEDLAEQAYTIVRGTVVSIGEPFEIRFGHDTVPATPITIKVDEMDKKVIRTLMKSFTINWGVKLINILWNLYLRRCQCSDDVIICLLPDGLDFGPCGIFKIKDDKAIVKDFQIQDDVSSTSEKTSEINANDLISEFEKKLK